MTAVRILPFPRWLPSRTRRRVRDPRVRTMYASREPRRPNFFDARAVGVVKQLRPYTEFAQGRTLSPACRGRRSYPGKVSSQAPDHARVIPLRPVTAAVVPTSARGPDRSPAQAPPRPAPAAAPPWALPDRSHSVREPLWRHIVGDVLRRERLAQERTLKDVAETARISMPYLSEIERGRKEPSSEVLAAAARALGLSLADLLGLARVELARLARPRPSKAPALVTRRHDVGPKSAGPAGQDDNTVSPAEALLPGEAVPPAETAPAETASPAETVPSVEALSTRGTGPVTSQLPMSMAA